MIRCPLIAALWMLTIFLATAPIHAAEPTAPSSPNDWKPGTIAEAQLKKQGFHPAYTEAEKFLQRTLNKFEGFDEDEKWAIRPSDLFIIKDVPWIQKNKVIYPTYLNESPEALVDITPELFNSLKTTKFRTPTSQCPAHYSSEPCGFPFNPVDCSEYDRGFTYPKTIIETNTIAIINDANFEIFKLVKHGSEWKLDGFKCLHHHPSDNYIFSIISFNMSQKHH